MNTAELLRVRLHAQLVEGGSARAPHDVVSHLLAMQAQDYAGTTWAIGLRTGACTLADVERAIAERSIVRTWPMRGTLHFLAAEDVRWMVPLLAPRVLARAKKRERDLGFEPATFERARELFSAALVGGRRLSRPDAMAMLEAGGISTAGQRGYHILWHLAMQGLLVVGPMEGRQQTFALLDEWVEPTPPGALGASMPREEALAALAARYFAGHGPATVADLARWADIPKREAQAALDAVAGGLESADHEDTRYWFAAEAAEAAAAAAPATVAPRVHLLPGFDEYMLGYVGRSHQLGEHLETYGSRVGANGMLSPTIVVDGQAVGVWKRTLKPRSVNFALTEFRPLADRERAAVAAEQLRYARFMGREVAEP